LHKLIISKKIDNVNLLRLFSGPAGNRPRVANHCNWKYKRSSWPPDFRLTPRIHEGRSP